MKTLTKSSFLGRSAKFSFKKYFYRVASAWNSARRLYSNTKPTFTKCLLGILVLSFRLLGDGECKNFNERSDIAVYL